MKLMSYTLAALTALAIPAAAKSWTPFVPPGPHTYARDIDPKGTTEGRGIGVVTWDAKPDAKGVKGFYGRLDFSNAAPAGGWNSQFYGFNTGGAAPFWGYHK